MNTVEILSSLGLTQNEAQVYLFFLYHREFTAAQASRDLGMDKSSCYRAVEKLQEWGLLVVTPKQRGSTYSATDPELLNRLVEKRKYEFLAQSDAISQLIDKLSKDVSISGLLKTNVKVEKGYQAIINMMEDRLNCESKLIRERWFSQNPFVDSKEYAIYVKNYAQRRVEKGVFLKGLYSERGVDVGYPELMIGSQQYLKEVKAWPKEMENNRQLFTIYGDKVAFISPKEKEMVVVTIQDEMMSGLMASMFDFVWSRCEEIKEEV